MARTIEENITKQSGSSFYYTFLFLPQYKRKAMHVVYAFCRITDDISDARDMSDEDKLMRLMEWQDELKLALNIKSRYELLNSLAKVIRELKMSIEPFFDLIDGVKMDLTKKRYETFDELKVYCYKVASTIGLMSIELFGYKNSASRDYAYNLGIAMQLTNILRDLKIDAQMNRIYIPQEDLKKFNYDEENLINSVYNKSFINLMKFEVDRTENFYTEANKFFHPEDHKVLAMGKAMEEIYYKVLNNIKKNNYDVFNKQNNVKKLSRILITFKNYFRFNLLLK